jgi:hypothetical protein
VFATVVLGLAFALEEVALFLGAVAAAGAEFALVLMAAGVAAAVAAAAAALGGLGDRPRAFGLGASPTGSVPLRLRPAIVAGCRRLACADSFPVCEWCGCGESGCGAWDCCCGDLCFCEFVSEGCCRDFAVGET